jgi:hypothetical protein
MNDKTKFVVLHVQDDPPDGYMPNYCPQTASVFTYESLEEAAVSNVGSHPDQRERGRPYRVIVIPLEEWHEFEVFSETVKGNDNFAAYPSDNPTLS